MQNKNALIVCAGAISLDQLKSYANKSDYIIAVDKGYDYLLEVSIQPDLLIGDFDSIQSSDISINDIKKFPTKKDFTDFEAALEYINETNYENVFILGACGLRLDHELANIDALKICLGKKNCLIIDEKNRIRLIDSYCRIYRKYKYFSLIPYSDYVKGVNICGSKYDVDSLDMLKGRTIGVSNEIVAEYADIKIKEGIVILIESGDKNV